MVNDVNSIEDLHIDVETPRPKDTPKKKIPMYTTQVVDGHKYDTAMLIEDLLEEERCNTLTPVAMTKTLAEPIVITPKGEAQT